MAYTPLAGKTGRVTIGSVSRNFKNWKLRTTGDRISTDRFEKTVDAVSGEYRKEILVGLTGTEVTISGRWDDGARPQATGAAATNGLFVGSSQTGIFLGLTPTIGFTCTGKITDASIDQEVTDAANFEITVFIETITFPAP